MKITRRRVEDAMKGKNKEDRIVLGGDFNGRIGERGPRNGDKERRENPKTRWKMQRGRDWWNGLKKMDGRN
jgi:selenophosphate synthetase-related protein